MFPVCLSRIAGSVLLVGILAASSGKAWQGEPADGRPKVLGATFSTTEVVADGRKQPAVRVDAVDPKSAIGMAGLQAGDVIYVVWQAEGRWRYDYPMANNLASLLFTLPLDEMLRFDILRQNGKLTKALKVKWSGDKSATINIDIIPLDRTAALAAIPSEIVQVQDLPGKAWRRLVPGDPRRGVSQGPGLVYIDPDGKSQFSKAGLKHGDIVVALTSGRRGAPRYDLNGTGSAANAFRQLASQDRLEVHYTRPQRNTGKPAEHRASLKFPRDLLALAMPPAQAPPPPVAAPPAAPAAPRPELTLMLATESVAVTPQLVGPGEDFDLVVRFRAADPAAAQSLNVMFSYRILAGAQVLLASKPAAISAQSGALTEYVHHLKASAQPGAYVVEVNLSYASKRAIDSVALRIQ